MSNGSWLNNGLSTYKAESNFNIVIEMHTMQSDTMFVAAIILFKKGFKYTRWFPNRKLPNFSLRVKN